MTSVALKRRRLELNMQEGWSAFAFLTLALVMVTWSVGEAGYGEGLGTLVFVTMGAALAGLFLAKSRFPWFLAHIFSLIYGTAWNAFLISYQLPKTFTARDRLLELGFRVGSWFQQAVLAGQRGTDPLMFAVVMSVLFWLMTYLAMWFSFRAHSLWASLLPGGIAMLLNLYYGPERIGFALVPYLLLILLFAVRYNLYTQERGWKTHRVRYDTDIVYSFLRYGFTLSLITIVLAWVVPTAASSERAQVFVSRFSEPWERFKEEWIRLFSTLQTERVMPTYNAFGTSLRLGGPVNLGNAAIMDVQTLAGRYWRAAVYDKYTGEGWVMSTDLETVFLEAGESPGTLVPYEARRTITQTFTLYIPEATQIYALGQPERFSLPIRASIVRVTSPEGRSQAETTAMVNTRYKLQAGNSYMVVSNIASAAESAMRQSGQDLPPWIGRYLALPDEVPQRVRDLAQQITSGYDNAYDKAMAIQDYLRAYTYNDQVEEPPAGVDRVDYFLFERKEGYCNYYASAMAVLARAVGIPARVAAGYAQGDWERDANAYRVREYHSHAWVEVFLPRFGWIEFEPTANQSVIVRPRVAGEGASDRTDMGDRGQTDMPEDLIPRSGGPFDRAAFERLLAEQRRQQQLRTWTRIGGVLAVSAVIIAAAWWFGRRRMEETRPAGAYYETMVRRGDRWGCKIEPFYTPNEYARQLSSALADSDGEKLVFRITEAYVGERYGNKNPARYQPDFAWRDLRPILARWGIRNSWNRLWRRRS